MSEPQPAWHKPKPCQLAAGPHQGRDPKLDLVPIQMTAHSDIAERHADRPIVNALLCNSLIDDRAISRHPMQRIDEYFRRREYIVEQPDVAKIVGLRQMKAQEVVIQRRSDQIQKLDLVTHFDLRARV